MPALTYLSHSAFLVEGEAGSLLIDPFITGNPKATVKLEDLRPDYILVSHGHGDHLGDTIGIAKLSGATVISNYEIALYCESKGVKAEQMHIGGSRKFPFGKVKLTIAHHGSGLEDGDRVLYMGNPCGFVITIDDKKVYHAGDTGVFMDMRLIGELDRIDVALLPIGDNFTMGVDDAVKAAEFLGARLNVPMHYDTFDLIAVDPDGFVEGVKALGLDARVVGPGESFEV